MKLTESKSILGRLMAEENILVEQRSGIQTAYFDLNAKLLVIPEFKEDISTNVIDLMISHEVSHCLHTPNDDWIEAIRELKISKSILNVVEDARIEKMVKSKYPGLKRIYHNGYKELMQNDFFGLSSVDVEELNLIDRINLYFKVGFLEFLDFTQEENKFVADIDSAETFSDVVRISKELQEYMQQRLEEEYETLKVQPDDFEPSDGESDESESSSEFDVEDNFAENSENPSDGITESGIDYSLPNGNSSSNEFDQESLEEYIENEMRSHTQESAEEKQKDLYKDDGRQTVYVDIPEIKLQDYIVDYSEILDKFSTSIDPQFVNFTNYKTFKAENSSVISYVIKEFNLKKNASGRKKVRISKSGDINLNKLYAHKVTQDIFKRSAIVPKEQSHGLVFFLDWSGSMTSYITDTVKQLLVLLTFCKKVNIPFEVYAFTTNYKYNGESELVAGKMILGPLHLMNLFSSRMPNNQFTAMSNYLLSFTGYSFVPNPSVKYWSEGTPSPNWFNLGNTPLNHTVVLSNAVMEAFKQRTKVQIANAVYLTDGESHGLRFCVEEQSNYDMRKYVRAHNLNTSFYNVYIRDRKSKEVMKYKRAYSPFEETNQITSFIRQISDYKMMAFRLISSRELKKYHYKLTSSYSTPDVSAFNKNNCLELETKFDKFYFVKTNLLDSTDEIGDISGKSTSSIARQFQKVMGNRVNSKIFLSKFVEFISEGL